MPKLFSRIFLIISTVFFFCQLSAQDNTPESKASCDGLIKKGMKANDAGKPLEALNLSTKAEIIAEKNQWKDLQVAAMISIGISNMQLSNYGEALGIYSDALKIAQQIKLPEQELKILNNIGTMYQKQRQFDQALQYFLDAYQIARNSKSFARVPIVLNIADAYTNLGKPSQAISYLDEIKDDSKIDLYNQYWTINYAEALLVSGNVAKAQKMMDALFERHQKENVNCYTCMAELLTRIYARKDSDRALQYANMGLKATNELSDKIKLYSQITSIYQSRNDFKKVSQYKDSILSAKDQMTSLNSKGIYEANQVKMKVEEYQSQLEIKTQRQRTERNMFIIGIIFTLLVFLFIYRGQQNRIIKQRQAQTIAENEKKIYDLELENLNNNIAEKNRKLGAKALYLSGRNELIEETVNLLVQLPEVHNNPKLNQSISTLKSYIKADSEWDDFIAYFEQVNPALIKNLTEKYPELNSSDIRFICYIYMNLDLREIGNIFNITYNATVKRHRRIKEKMNIDTEISISEFLLQKFTNQ